MEKFHVSGVIHGALDIILLLVFFKRKKFPMKYIFFKHSFISIGKELIIEYLDEKLHLSFDRNS